MSPMIKQPLAMEHALLGLLSDQPAHAYEIHQRLRQAIAPITGTPNADLTARICWQPMASPRCERNV